MRGELGVRATVAEQRSFFICTTTGEKLCLLRIFSWLLWRILVHSSSTSVVRKFTAGQASSGTQEILSVFISVYQCSVFFSSWLRLCRALLQRPKSFAACANSLPTSGDCSIDSFSLQVVRGFTAGQASSGTRRIFTSSFLLHPLSSVLICVHLWLIPSLRTWLRLRRAGFICGSSLLLDALLWL